MTVLSDSSTTHMLVPSNAIAAGSSPTGKVPSAAPVGESSVTVLSVWFTTHMFVPSNAIATGFCPTGKVPIVAPAGESCVTALASGCVTHMLLPSKAIAYGALPSETVPRGPHVEGTLGWQGSLVQSPTPSGARQSLAAAGHVLQGPIAQSLSCAQTAPSPPDALDEALLAEEEALEAEVLEEEVLPPAPPEEALVDAALEEDVLPPAPPEEAEVDEALPPAPPEEADVDEALPPAPPDEADVDNLLPPMPPPLEAAVDVSAPLACAPPLPPEVVLVHPGARATDASSATAKWSREPRFLAESSPARIYAPARDDLHPFAPTEIEQGSRSRSTFALAHERLQARTRRRIIATMQIKSLPAFLASIALAGAASHCARHAEHVCTEKACRSSATVLALLSPAAAALGEHRFAIEVDGAAITCTVQLTSLTAVASGTCTGKAEVRIGPMMRGKETKVGEVVEYTEEPVPGQFAWTLTFEGEPSRAHVVHTTSGRTIVDRTASFGYHPFRPNGPGCEPVCQAANVTWDLTGPGP